MLFLDPPTYGARRVVVVEVSSCGRGIGYIGKAVVIMTKAPYKATKSINENMLCFKDTT